MRIKGTHNQAFAESKHRDHGQLVLTIPIGTYFTVGNCKVYIGQARCNAEGGDVQVIIQAPRTTEILRQKVIERD